MRDALNFNFLPIVQDEMNGLAVRTCMKGYSPNISNGYYGYQPVVVQHKGEQHEQMDVVECDARRQQNTCRKRAWDCDEAAVFKRRRENDIVSNRGQQKGCDVMLEELLKGTHGGDLYNYWTCDEL